MERSKKKIMFLDAATAEWKLLLAVWAKSQEPWEGKPDGLLSIDGLLQITEVNLVEGVMLTVIPYQFISNCFVFRNTEMGWMSLQFMFFWF